jgi:hypothetical protein
MPTAKRRKGRRADLTPEQRALLLPIVQRLVDEHDGNQSELARKVDPSMAPSQFSRFLAVGSKTGFSIPIAIRICQVAGIDPRAIGLTASPATLREIDGWEDAAAVVDGYQPDAVDAAGDTVPPRPLSRVTPAVVEAYAAAWLTAARELRSKVPFPAVLDADAVGSVKRPAAAPRARR